jgi:hypothetical protein
MCLFLCYTKMALINVSSVFNSGGSCIGTVELHHPIFPLDIIDNI